MNNRTQTATSILGLASVALFAAAFFSIAILNRDFDIASDYISKLGAQGQPYAIYWNTFGFGLVGLALAAFGWCFGLCMNDRLLGACLLLSGLGFTMAAIPTDLFDATSELSKAHYVSVCVALAGWCLGLARLSSSNFPAHFARHSANYTILLSLLPLFCVGGGVSAEPIAHRIVLVIAFGWVILNSLRLLKSNITPELAL